MNNSTKLEYEVPVASQQQISNCQFFKDKYFFFFCEKYCEQYDMVQASPIFDGDLVQLRKFIKHFFIYKNQAFYYPNNNLFFKDVNEIEPKLMSNLEGADDEEYFLQSKSNQLEFENMKTDFSYTQGVNPLQSGQNSIYPLEFTAFEQIKRALILLCLVW